MNPYLHVTVFQCFIYINKGLNERNTTPPTIVVSTVFYFSYYESNKTNGKARNLLEDPETIFGRERVLWPN